MGGASRNRTGKADPERGIKGVIFDCDGVLIDSKQANVRFYNLILAELGFAEMSPEDEEYVHSQTVTESIRYLVPEQDLERAIQAAKNISYKSVLPWIQLRQGLVSALERLRDRGVPCAINTNRTGTMGLILDTFGIRSYFSPVVTASTVRHPKPHPESLYYILSTWGMAPDQVIFIGDTEVDCRAAHAAGVPFWAFDSGDLAAVCHIDDHQQVCETIGQSPNTTRQL